MDQYSIGQAALRAAPRRVGQAAVIVLALGLWANTGWATSLVNAVVQHRTDAVVRAVQDAVGSLLPRTVLSPAPTEKG